jgi:hypothetical protein
MSIFLEQAIQILNSVDVSDPKMQQAKTKLTELTAINKSASMDSATLQNIVLLLTPFVAYYKVNQVLKLLKELANERPTKKYL